MKNIKAILENYIPEFDVNNPNEGYLQYLEIMTEANQEVGLSSDEASNLAHKSLEEHIGQLRYSLFNEWLDEGSIGNSDNY